MTGRGGLSALFSPASIAVVGASPSPGKISSVILDSLARAGFAGKVYPVNPAHAEIGALRCYPSVASIGERVDLAVIAVPAERALALFREAAPLVRAAVIVSGGFGETGEKGRRMEREIRELARAHGVRVVGPNCMGIYDTVSRVDTFFVPGDRVKRPGPGRLSIISQSGSFAVTAMDELAAEGIGVARVVSYGNMADVSECDCLDFLADDPHTGAVAIYMESVSDGRAFVEAAARCTAKKPVIAIKAGRSAAASAAARSHTGALAGRQELYGAAFRKAGVMELGGYEEFIAGCKALAMSKAAAGRRVAVITDGGGVGVDIADACAVAGLAVPALPGEVAAALNPLLPPFCSLTNPIDLTGSATDLLYALAVEKTLASGGFDMAIVAALLGPPGLTDALASAIAAKALAAGKPVVVCSPGGEFSRKKAALFTEAGLPVFRSPEAAVKAAAILAGVGRGAARTGPLFAGGGAMRAEKRPVERLVKEAASLARKGLTEPEAKRILALSFISVPESRVVKEVAAALDAAEELGYPVALKVVSPDIPHKSDSGGVAVGIASREELEKSWTTMVRAVAGANPSAAIEGFLVERVARRGVEVIVGAMRDERFGPVVLFGLGGGAVELYRDVSFRLAPLDEDEALDMMREVKGFPLLDGYRGAEKLDVRSVAAVIVELGRIAADVDGLADIEINPLMVYKEGVMAVDARATLVGARARL